MHKGRIIKTEDDLTMKVDNPVLGRDTIDT